MSLDFTIVRLLYDEEGRWLFGQATFSNIYRKIKRIGLLLEDFVPEKFCNINLFSAYNTMVDINKRH